MDHRFIETREVILIPSSAEHLPLTTLPPMGLVEQFPKVLPSSGQLLIHFSGQLHCDRCRNRVVFSSVQQERLENGPGKKLLSCHTAKCSTPLSCWIKDLLRKCSVLGPPTHAQVALQGQLSKLVGAHMLIKPRSYVLGLLIFRLTLFCCNLRGLEVDPYTPGIVLVTDVVDF